MYRTRDSCEGVLTVFAARLYLQRSLRMDPQQHRIRGYDRRWNDITPDGSCFWKVHQRFH